MSTLRDRARSANSPSPSPGDPRRQRRTTTLTDVVVTTDDGEYKGTTANLSNTGVLVMLPQPAVPVGTPVNVNLSNPVVELELAVAGKVIHLRPLDGGMTAHGIQLHYPADRIDEVMAFIEFLQKFGRLRRNGQISGPIDAAGLGPLLDLFATTAPGGTLDVRRGEETGKIIFSENYLLHCVLGLATGSKALARMFRWTDGCFVFHHDLQLGGAEPEPEPIEAAMMRASVQTDEMNRFAGNSFRGADTFARAAAADPDQLGELEREVLAYAGDGFSVDAVSDMIAAPDADIWKAFHTLVDGGHLVLQR